jgi:hypothetical protein
MPAINARGPSLDEMHGRIPDQRSYPNSHASPRGRAASVARTDAARSKSVRTRMPGASLATISSIPPVSINSRLPFHRRLVCSVWTRCVHDRASARDRAKSGGREFREAASDHGIIEISLPNTSRILTDSCPLPIKHYTPPHLRIINNNQGADASIITAASAARLPSIRVNNTSSTTLSSGE